MHKKGQGRKSKNPGRHKITPKSCFGEDATIVKNITNINKNAYWGGTGPETTRSLCWYWAGPLQKKRVHYLGGEAPGKAEGGGKTNRACIGLGPKRETRNFSERVR